MTASTKKLFATVSELRPDASESYVAIWLFFPGVPAGCFVKQS